MQIVIIKRDLDVISKYIYKFINLWDSIMIEI
jgi:hypothetical protein